MRINQLHTDAAGIVDEQHGVAEMGQILGGEHCEGGAAGESFLLGGRRDLRMPVGGAQEITIGLSRQLPIGREATTPSDEPVFASPGEYHWARAIKSLGACR